MRRLRGGGITLALLLGLAAPALAEEPLDLANKAAGANTNNSSKSGSWFGSLFGRKERPEDKKLVPAVPQLSPAERAASARKREEEAYKRRNEACCRLKVLANQAGDMELLRRIEELDERNWALFQQRTAVLPEGGASRLDETAIEQNLGGSGSQPTAPAVRLRPDGSRAGKFGGGDIR